MLFIKSIIFTSLFFINSVYVNAVDDRDVTDINRNQFSDRHPGPAPYFSTLTSSRAHSLEFSDGTCILRSPSTAEEWIAYHDIRQAEIVKRYCAKDYIYNPAHPDELSSNNFRFVLFHMSLQKVVGVIRVDLLDEEGESSIRWVAIAEVYHNIGHGTRMLSLVERFVKTQDRRLIRVPAEEAAKKFYLNFGFVPDAWPKAPQDDGKVFLSKRVIGNS